MNFINKMTITKNQILHISLEILIFLTYSIYTNKKIKSIKNEHENKINILKSKIDELNKKYDLLFELIKENNQSHESIPTVIPSQNTGIKKRKKIYNDPYFSSFQKQNTPQFKNAPSKQNTESKINNEIPSQVNNQPFDLVSNIINIMGISSPLMTQNNETKIEIIEDEKFIDDEIKDDLDSLLENKDETNDTNEKDETEDEIDEIEEETDEEIEDN